MIASVSDISFANALKDDDRRLLVAFPKADRHCHSLLGASLQSIAEWSGRPLAPPPPRMASFDEMRTYAHSVLYPCIRNRPGFELTAETTISEAIRDGVSILEMSLDADFTRLYEAGVTGLLDFVRKLVGRHTGKIEFRPEVGISKNRDPAAQIRLATECVESGLFRSIDLYGNEHAQPPDAYADLFREAKARGLKLKAHVGEFGDAALVEKTVRELDLDEIQHGVAVATSGRVMRLLRERHIRLNVCPSSNVALSVVTDLRHHPIRTLTRSGLRVTINSDDKTIFGNTVTDEYRALFRAGTLTAEELEIIRVESLSE